jgi:2-oxo-4-hydroxy-4-carboxy--5-ureidoimidazoline (OHCU) decarboxylase
MQPSPPPITLDATDIVTTAAPGAGARRLGGRAGSVPWVAGWAPARSRSHATVADLHHAVLKLLADRAGRPPGRVPGGCPKIGSKAARQPAGDLTDASRAEPGSLGLDRLSGEAFIRFDRPNTTICRGS